MHFGDHLCSVEEHQQRVQGKGDILQGWVVLKGLRCIHTHRNDTDYGTGPQERMNPLRTKNTICFREWNILMVSVLHIFLTEQVHSQLSLLYLIYPLKNEYAYLKCGHICTFMVHFTTFWKGTTLMNASIPFFWECTVCCDLCAISFLMPNKYSVKF